MSAEVLGVSFCQWLGTLDHHVLQETEPVSFSLWERHLCSGPWIFASGAASFGAFSSSRKQIWGGWKNQQFFVHRIIKPRVCLGECGQRYSKEVLLFVEPLLTVSNWVQKGVTCHGHVHAPRPVAAGLLLEHGTRTVHFQHHRELFPGLLVHEPME